MKSIVHISAHADKLHSDENLGVGLGTRLVTSSVIV